MSSAPLNVVDTGRGDPAIVFVHGFTCSLSDWSEQLPVLSAHHRCVALDLPGHGASPAPREATIRALAEGVNATLEHLGLTRVVLVGHSMGCRVVSEAFGQAADRVRGIVYIEGSMLAEGDADAAVQATRDAIERVGMESMTARIYDGFFADSTPAPVRAVVNARRASVDLDFARRLWLDLVRWDAARSRAALQAVTVPVLVIQSTYLNSEMKRLSLSPGQSGRWPDTVAKTVPDVTVAVIAGIGHFPMLEAPRETNAAIATFARKVSS